MKVRADVERVAGWPARGLDAESCAWRVSSSWMRALSCSSRLRSRSQYSRRFCTKRTREPMAAPKGRRTLSRRMKPASLESAHKAQHWE